MDAAAPPLQAVATPRPETASVKVALRIRPLSAEEQRAGERVCVRKDPTGAVAQLLNTALGGAAYAFDDVYDTGASQADVFGCVRPLLDAFVDGYNATVFAYGQVRRRCVQDCGVRRHSHQPAHPWPAVDRIGQDVHDGLGPDPRGRLDAAGHGRRTRCGIPLLTSHTHTHSPVPPHPLTVASSRC
jgi:hypothetical protein